MTETESFCKVETEENSKNTDFFSLINKTEFTGLLLSIFQKADMVVLQNWGFLQNVFKYWIWSRTNLISYLTY